MLTEKLEIKRVAFLDILKEEAEKNAENATEQFDADFALMTGELARFLSALIIALGGETISDEVTPAVPSEVVTRDDGARPIAVTENNESFAEDTC